MYKHLKDLILQSRCKIKHKNKNTFGKLLLKAYKLEASKLNKVKKEKPC